MSVSAKIGRSWTPDQSPSIHDLSVDESMGGHTLTRHVGKTDAELLDRLRQEPQISSGSTYIDRATATLDFTEVPDLLLRLACRWAPPSREALAALLTATADPPSNSHGL